VEPRAIQALLVTPDPSLVTAFTAVCRELGIEVRTTAGNEGIIEELQKAKYEGIPVDFDTAPDPTGRRSTASTGKGHKSPVPSSFRWESCLGLMI